MNMKKIWGIGAIAALAATGLMLAVPAGSENAPRPSVMRDELFLVESVLDGRHFTVIWKEREVKVGVRGIDVDALETPAGEESATTLRRDILGIKVLVRNATDLGNGAFEADVLLDGQSVAERLVSAGLAKAAVDGPLKNLELAAQRSGVGNWAPPASPESAESDAQSAVTAEKATEGTAK
jgi:endonuclease YncB( thermonuclease family)